MSLCCSLIFLSVEQSKALTKQTRREERDKTRKVDRIKADLEVRRTHAALQKEEAWYKKEQQRAIELNAQAHKEAAQAKEQHRKAAAASLAQSAADAAERAAKAKAQATLDLKRESAAAKLEAARLEKVRDVSFAYVIVSATN